jgi:chemotaxis signal transduction protein
MTSVANETAIAGRAAELREEFDQIFTRPEASELLRRESVLALSFDTAPYAVMLSEVAELGRAPEILDVPSRVPAFLGLIAVRGALLPAYDLAAMLGHSRAESRAWMLLIRTPHAVALIFDDFEGHRHVAPADRAGEAVRDADIWRPLVRLSTLINTLQEKHICSTTGLSGESWRAARCCLLRCSLSSASSRTAAS